MDDEILWDIVKNRLTPLKVVCINIKNKI
ncbi:hypothetical protein [Leptospira inadai]|nr:hypothetical protein [Leptospira inadai]